MRKSILIASILSLFATSALADHKPGTFTGVRKCTGVAGDVEIDVTSKRTIGVATCKNELQKKFILKGLCIGKKGEKVEYEYTFGRDADPQQAKGTATLYCR